MSQKHQHLTTNKVLGLVCSIILSAASTQAADKQWSAGTADYNNAVNWSPAGIPGATDNAINDNGTGNAVQINIGDPDWTVGQIRAGNSAGNGAFVQNGQTVTALGTNYNGPVISEFFTPFRLGIVAADTGVYTLNGGTLIYGSGPLNIGEVGTGTLNINGGTINGSGYFSVNPGGIAVPNPAVITGTAGHGPYLGDFAYYEVGYAPAPHAGTGLPAPGTTITSVTQADHSYKFAPTYTANNAFILDTAVPSATITLATPTVCSGLSFMGSAGNGPVNVNYTVNHVSGAPETGNLSIPDWFGTGQEVFNVEGRVDATGVNFQYPGTAGGNPVGNAPYLLSVDIDTSANPAAVVSINLTYVSGGGTFATATILGVSGQDILANPFTPLTVSGYNSDVIIEAGAPSPNVASSITDTVTQTGGTVAITGEMHIGNGPATSHGTYNVSGGALNVHNWFSVGRVSGVGVMNISGSASITQDVNGNFMVGDGGSGVVNQSGGTNDVSGELHVADGGASSGTYNMSGGVLNAHNWFQVGRGGAALVNFTGGTINKLGGGAFIIGDNATVSARVIQTGAGTTFNCANDYWIGNNTTGELDLTNGVMITGTLSVGNNGAGTGTFEQSGGSVNANGEFWVGQGGGKTGLYNLSGGGTITVHNWVSIGRNGGSGTVNLESGSISKVGGGAFSIGGDGGANGTLNQSAGTSLSVTAGDTTYLGQGTGNGTWNMNGGTANLELLQFCEGGNGSGVLNLAAGAVLRAVEVNSGTNGLPSNSTFNFDGGTLQAGSDNANFFYDITTVNMNFPVIIDSQGYNVTVLQNLPNGGGVGTSGLVKNGSGTLTLAGTNTYTGATTVNNGILGVPTTALTTSSGFSVANGAGLAVQVVGALNSQFSVSSVALAGGVHTLNFDLGSFGNPSVAPLNVSGSGGFTANGVITINVSDAAPVAGQMPLVKYAGAMGGTPTFVMGSLPAGVSASISNNVLNQSVDLVISLVNLPRWDGQVSGNWDLLGETNWFNTGTATPTFYTELSPVVFDDNALGTTSVNLAVALHPASVTVNNSNLIYTFTGPGKISGSTGLTKTGSNLLTMANASLNDYTGPTVIADGTLSVTNLADGGSPSAIGKSGSGAANLVFSGGTLAYSGPTVTINRSYSTAAGASPAGLDTANNVTFNALISGNGGEFQKKGAGQVAYVAPGKNDLTGYLVNGSAYRVTAGSVLLDGSAGPQTNYTRSLFLGRDAGVPVAMTLSNTVLWVHDSLFIGQASGTATMTMTNSTLNLEGNPICTASGGSAVGTLNINDGTINNNGEFWLGEHDGDIGTNNIGGSALINLHNWVAVGRGGLGVLNLKDNATIHHFNNGRFLITDNGDNVGNNHGIVNVSGNATLQCDGDLDLGHGNNNHPREADLNVSGGSVNVNGWFTLGRDGQGTANLNMSGGKLDANNELHVSEAGWTSSINMSGGLLVAHSWFQIGRNGGGGATINLSGGTIHHNNNGGVVLCDGNNNNPCTINQTGGYFTSDGGDWLIGNGPGGGTWNQSSGTNLSLGGNTFIGSGGPCTVDLSGNASWTANGWFVVGGSAGNTGTLNISGNAALTKNGDSGNHLSIGDGGGTGAQGVINQTGGTVTSLLSDTYLGAQSTPGQGASTGTWNLGPGTAVLSDLRFTRDAGTTGIMNLLAGGTLIVGEININGPSGTSEFHFNGGTLKASASDATFMQGLTLADVQAGGATIDTGVNTISIGQALLDGTGGGGLTKVGNGTLRLNGNNTYTGTTLVSVGTLGGTGTFAGPVSVALGAAFSPGASIGTITITNTLNLAAGSTTVMEVNATANTSDHVSVSSTATLGGTLVLKNLSGTLAINQTFQLFTAGSFSGSFSSVVSQTPNQTVTWDLSQLAPGGNGTVKVASTVPALVTLSPAVTAGKLNFTWPASQIGWQLQHQVNPLTIGIYTNWVPVAGSTTTNAVSVPIDSNEATEFYRLVFPAQ